MIKQKDFLHHLLTQIVNNQILNIFIITKCTLIKADSCYVQLSLFSLYNFKNEFHSFNKQYVKTNFSFNSKVETNKPHFKLI